MNGRQWIDSLVARGRAILRGRRVEQDLNEELSFHEEMQTKANLQDGMSAEDARRRARVGMGIEQAKEHVREARPLRWGHDLGRDIHLALRSLWRTPGFTAIAVMTVALGVGANTAIFSVLNTYLLRPMPYKNPE